MDGQQLYGIVMSQLDIIMMNLQHKKGGKK